MTRDHSSFTQTVLIALFILVSIGAAALLTVATGPPAERRGALTFYAVFALFLFVVVRVRKAAQRRNDRSLLSRRAALGIARLRDSTRSKRRTAI